MRHKHTHLMDRWSADPAGKAGMKRARFAGDKTAARLHRKHNFGGNVGYHTRGRTPTKHKSRTEG